MYIPDTCTYKLDRRAGGCCVGNFSRCCLSAVHLSTTLVVLPAIYDVRYSIIALTGYLLKIPYESSHRYRELSGT